MLFLIIPVLDISSVNVLPSFLSSNPLYPEDSPIQKIKILVITLH